MHCVLPFQGEKHFKSHLPNFTLVSLGVLLNIFNELTHIVFICDSPLGNFMNLMFILPQRHCDPVREGTFFLGGGGRAGASEGRVISEGEH